MHALVLNGSTLSYREFGSDEPPTLAANKGAWLPVVDEADPAYDADTHYLGPVVETVEADQVTRARSAVAKTLSEVKAERTAAVELQMAAVFNAGFTVPSSFNAVSLTPLAGHVLQVAEDGNKLDWLTSQAAYSAAVAGGGGAVSGALFRDKDNTNVEVTYEQGLMALLAMADWGKETYRNRWALKDAIAAASDVAAVLAIDVTGGW